MRHVEVVPTTDGRWMYTVYVAGSIAVVGFAVTRERAFEHARLA